MRGNETFFTPSVNEGRSGNVVIREGNEMSKKISWTITNSLESIRASAAKLETEFAALNETANAATGVVMDVKPLTGLKNVPSVSFFRREGLHSSLQSDRNVEETVKRALNYVENGFSVDKALHEENKVALENNKKFCESVERIMTNAGIPPTYKVGELKRGRIVYSERRAGWMEDLIRCVKTDDGFSVSERIYRDQLMRIAEWEKSEKEKEVAAAKEKEEAEKKLVAERELAVFIVKYSLPTMSSWTDVLDVVLAKDKYLRLAYWLEKNRGDWMDGCDYAKMGLDSFNVETNEDAEISNELYSLCDNWEGDGRVFRDCQFNYTFLYSKVSKELMSEFEAVLKYVN